MTRRLVTTTVTRIASIEARLGEVTVSQVPRQQWGTGDYVVGRVHHVTGGLRQVERPDGRMAQVSDGDLVVGALGRRAATLEAVGDWRDIGSDGQMHLLTSAGLMGRATSLSPFLPPLVHLQYAGHVHLDDRAARMSDYVSAAEGSLNCPVVLVIGTSMSAGKTESAKVTIRLLRERKLRVVGAKLTGAARYRDSLSMWDAGAERVFDFVDGGLPSTACPPQEYLPGMRSVLAKIQECDPDVAVIEAGASPLEEYNGSVLADVIGEQVVLTLLCASDPYAVVGLVSAFGRQPDLVAGGSANTTAAAELVGKLTGLRALNLMDQGTHAELGALLDERLGL